MLMVPAMARAPVSAVGARRISMRSTCSGVRLSKLKPGGTRWPSISNCVKPFPSPRMRGGPPRPGAPGVVTPGRRRSTSPSVASPNLSISSRPITILAAVERRRSSVSDSRPPVISICCVLLADAARAGADAARAGADAAAVGLVCAEAVTAAHNKNQKRPGANAGCAFVIISMSRIVAAAAARPNGRRRICFSSPARRVGTARYDGAQRRRKESRRKN